MTKSHQPSGFGWSREGCLFSTFFLFNLSGFNPKGRGLPFPLPCIENPIQIPPLDFIIVLVFVFFRRIWIQILMALGIDVLRYSNAFWVAKRSQVGSKIVSKIDLGGVSGGSWRVLGGSWRPKPKKEKSYPFWGPILGPSWGRLGAVLGLSWAALASKMEPKSKQKCI